MKNYTWDIVRDNSTIILKAKYHLYGNIVARFSEFSGSVITEELFKNPEILININANSIHTQNPEQDKKLRSSSYFSALDYPVITFYSLNNCGLSSGGIKELTGRLYIKGADHAVTLIVNFSEIKYLSRGANARFHLYCHVNFKDWQLGTNEDDGISDDVLIIVEMFLVRKKRS